MKLWNGKIEALNKGWSILIIAAFILALLAFVGIGFTVFSDSFPAIIMIQTKVVQVLVVALMVALALPFIILFLQLFNKWKDDDPLTDLKYVKKVGEIQRGNQLRHVLFSCKSFMRIMEAGFSKSLIVDETTLKEVGKEIGVSFGIDFITKCLKEKDTGDYMKAIKKWCDFDKRAGWGVWESKFKNKNDYLEGDIIISNNFLIKATTDSNSIIFCAFLVGYIEGVLQELTVILAGNKKRNVEVTQIGNCGSNLDNNNCSFHYTLGNYLPPISQI